MANHEGLEIPNLHCFLVMRSLKSRNYVTEIFTWRWHYYFLKNEGVKFLRDYLGLPATVIPNTHKVEKVAQSEEEVAEGEEKQDRGEGRGRGGRGFRGRGRGGRGFRGGNRREETAQEA
jgi:small subunit ribosomal protein S10e